MTRSAVCVACVTLLCLGASSRAQADEVQTYGVILTGGFLQFDPTEPSFGGFTSMEGTAFSMGGTSQTGFRLEGFGDSSNGFSAEPLQGCVVSCAPGDQIGTSAAIGRWEDGSFVVLDGQSYALTGLPPDAGARINIGGGPITVPAFRPSVVVATTSIVVQDSAFAAFGNGSQLGPFADIQGEGRVSLTFAPASEKGLWDLRDIRYDFGPTPTPTPEPATLTLISGALVAATIRARTRRERRRGPLVCTPASSAACGGAGGAR
jgi:hypothetical protein